MLFVSAAMLFLISGRSNGSYGDLASIYGSTRCISSKCNPYIISNVEAQLLLNGADPREFVPPFWPEHQPDYPPLTYDLLLPMAFVSYPAAGLAYFWISGLALIVASLVTIILSPLEARTVTSLGASAVLMTSGTMLRLGQVSTLTIALVVMGSALFLSHTRRSTAGVLLALAAGLKPQLAVPFIVFFCFFRDTRKYALGALGGFFLATAAACIALTYRLQSLAWTQDFLDRVHSAIPVRIDTGLVNLSSVTKLAIGNPIVYQLIDLILFSVVAAVLYIAFLRSKGSEEAKWVLAAAMCYLTLIVVYHRTYDMRIQILSFPALGIVWRRSWRLAAVLTVISSMMLFSTALIMENWFVAHLGHDIARKLLFRVLVERQQAIAVFLGTVMWTIAAFQTAVCPANRWRQELQDIKAMRPRWCTGRAMIRRFGWCSRRRRVPRSSNSCRRC
jgi:hypothetical protein